MMPRGVNPRQMQQAMKKMGITQEEWDDVDEVIISRGGKSYVFKKPAVTAVKMQGQNTFQIVGDYKVIEGKVAPAAAGPKKPEIPEEDVELVASQAKVSMDEARAALEECNGEPAEAIIKLMSRRNQ